MANEQAETTRKPRPGEIPGALPFTQTQNQIGKSGEFATNAPHHNTATNTSYATAEDFLNDHRIHVKHGSFFIGAGLALHPEELDPKHEAKLRKKLENTYKFNSPSFFENFKRANIALNLGAMIPASLENERNSLMRQITAFNEKLEHGIPNQAAEAATYRMPMQTASNELYAERSQQPDPLGIEYATNGVAMYLMLREAMTRRGFLKPLTDYIDHFGSPDQIVNSLKDALGLDVRQVREAALGGVGAVGQLLGLEDNVIYDIQNISQYIAQKRFSLNAIEHWHIGKQLLPNAPIEAQIAAGMPARIEYDIQKFRAMAGGQYHVPENIASQERSVAKALELIEPAERDLLFRLGYNIGYTPDRVADAIADYPGILGLHRKISNDLIDIDGNYYIYFAGQLDEKKALRTLRHEIAHNLWPTRFSLEERQTMDGLAESDNNRLQALRQLTTTHKEHFKNLVEAYQAGNTAEKQAVIESANAYFSKLGLRFDTIMPHLKGVEQLSWLVSEADTKLRVDGDFYNRTAYYGASVRFREVISRYSELQYIAYREQPDMQAMLQFVVPGMHTLYNQYYLPHIKRLRDELANPELQQNGVNVNTVQTDVPGKEPKNPPLPVAAEFSHEGTGMAVDRAAVEQNARINSAVAALAERGIRLNMAPNTPGASIC